MQVTRTKHPTHRAGAWSRSTCGAKLWRYQHTTVSAATRQHNSPGQSAKANTIQNPLTYVHDLRISARSIVCRAKAPGIFPAGQKQATVPSPAFCLFVDSFMLLNDASFVDQLNQLVNNGVNLVILSDSSGGAALYDGALKLKEVLRDRADLLILDRTDICIAVGAKGVLLSSQGVPVVVGRRMLQNQVALIGREASTAEEAATAAADGANFILLKAPDGSFPNPALLRAARDMQRSGNPIPILLSSTNPTLPVRDLQAILSMSPDGVALPPDLVQQAASACSSVAAASSSAQDWAVAIWDALNGQTVATPAPTTTPVATVVEVSASTTAPPAPPPIPTPPPPTPTAPPAAPATAAPQAPVEVFEGVVRQGSSLRRLLSEGREALVAEEKVLLARLLELLEEVCPQLDALPLLREATKQLDDRFLVVVVGEFNSGKSSVVNALLGARFLAEGILPTTNEVTVLRYCSDPEKAATVERQDGLVVRHLQAELLREMNVVDTPGTNVILERQQRLTEEFVPRADLVLFVMSCDRPFTESEVKFLEYIRTWKKKIVFVVNKVDMLSNEQEVQEIVRFVSDNAQRLLKLDDPFVWPVSSRLALRAKQEFSGTNGALNSLEDERIGDSDEWLRSRFATFERFIVDFLVGGGSGRSSGEGFRLKLQTPLSIADALMEAAGEYLKGEIDVAERELQQGEIDVAERELQSVCAVSGHLQRFSSDMVADGEAQRSTVRRLISEAVTRAEAYVDRTVKVSNVTMLSDYVLGSNNAVAGSNFENEIVGPLYGQLRNVTQEHQAWVAANCENQLRHYSTFLQPRDEAASTNGSGPGPSSIGAMAVQRSSTSSSSALVAGSSGSTALATVSEFDVRSAGILLEEEIREAVIGTAGTAAGASGLGLLATGVLANTLEDVLVLGVAGLASYVAVLNLPLRRAEIKKKLAGVAERFAKAVEERMESELKETVDSCTSQVGRMVEPLQTSCAMTVFKLRRQEEAREDLATQLSSLQRKIATMD